MTNSGSNEDREAWPKKLCLSHSWLLGDHLGSTSMVVNASGVMVNETRYSAFGETRYQYIAPNETLRTDYLYTGQRQEAEIGLYFYLARWYDPAIGRFIQADSILPDSGSPLGYDRFAYVSNNPLKYVDPSGHSQILLDGVQLASSDIVSTHFSVGTNLSSNNQSSATQSSPSRPNRRPNNNPPNTTPQIDGGIASPPLLPNLTATTSNTNTQSGLETQVVTEKMETEAVNVDTSPYITPEVNQTSSTCYPASIAGGLGILALAPVDYALFRANMVVPLIPDIGPFVEVVILIPVDAAVLDLHLAFAGIVIQGTSKPCDEVKLELLPPWGIGD